MRNKNLTFQNLRTIRTGFWKIKDPKMEIVPIILGKFNISYTPDIDFITTKLACQWKLRI